MWGQANVWISIDIHGDKWEILTSVLPIFGRWCLVELKEPKLKSEMGCACGITCGFGAILGASIWLKAKHPMKPLKPPWLVPSMEMTLATELHTIRDIRPHVDQWKWQFRSRTWTNKARWRCVQQNRQSSTGESTMIITLGQNRWTTWYLDLKHNRLVPYAYLQCISEK